MTVSRGFELQLAWGLLLLGSLAYSLFWLANKAVLLAYHPDLADLHWLLRYFWIVGLVDFLVPLSLWFTQIKRPRLSMAMFVLGLSFMLVTVWFQEGSLQVTFQEATREA